MKQASATPVPQPRKAVDRPGAGYKIGPHEIKPIPPDAVWLTSNQTRARYGGKSAMWLWNQVEHNPEFPKPCYVGRRQMYSVAELDAYDQKLILRRSDALQGVQTP
jgi:hypothetical protein